MIIDWPNKLEAIIEVIACVECEALCIGVENDPLFKWQYIPASLSVQFTDFFSLLFEVCDSSRPQRSIML